MTRCGYLFVYWINIIDKHCVKGSFLLTTIEPLHFLYLIKLQNPHWRSEMAKQHQKWILQPYKPNSSGVTHNFVTSGSKIDFCHVSWRPSWIMQIIKIAQSGRNGNQAGYVLRPPRNTNHQKNVIGKNISRSHNEFVKRSNRLHTSTHEKASREREHVITARNKNGHKPNNKYEFQHAETDKRLGYFMRAIIWLNAHLVQFKQFFLWNKKIART